MPQNPLPFFNKTSGRIGVAAGCALLGLLISLLGVCGCSHLPPRQAQKEAADLARRGSFEASLGQYEQMLKKYPKAADRMLFEMGMIYAHPDNRAKDYPKALALFETVVGQHPDSPERTASEMMIAHIHNLLARDKRIALQSAQIDALEATLQSHHKEILALQKMLEGCEEKNNGKVVLVWPGSVDRILIEKGQRRMTLFSKGRAVKTYKIALGGNPDGPKEKQGDNKTPEGLYVIEGRNHDSQYHVALRISYPNEKDKKRARQLGVTPGGDIMIHGIKKDFSWIGERHTERDWTQGCIAVTDEEIEEIEKLVPDGALVDIRP